MKNVRIKVTEGCTGNYWYFGIYENRKILMCNGRPHQLPWCTLKAAIRNAKAMAERIGIKYDLEIVKQHGC